MNMYAVFTLVLCGVYGVFMVIQGLANYRKTSGSTETFYNADRGVNTFMLVCSTAVSVFSGLAFYGWPSSSYKLGAGYISGMGAFCVGLEFAVIGYRLWLLGKEYGFTTPIDFLRSRYYSEKYGVFCAILMVAMIVPYVALQLITIGDGMNVSTKGFVPYFLAVLFACAIICFHVFGGGMKAVAWMDTFNFILGVGTLWVLVVVLVVRNFDGGMVGVYEAIKNDPVSVANLGAPGATGYFTIPGIINQALTASVATIVWPHIYSRCYIAKSKKNFEVMAWGLPLGYLMTFTGLILIGIYIGPGILGSGFDKADSLVPYLATNFAPPIVSAVAMLCLFAFAISTGESMLLSGHGDQGPVCSASFPAKRTACRRQKGSALDPHRGNHYDDRYAHHRLAAAGCHRGLRLQALLPLLCHGHARHHRRPVLEKGDQGGGLGGYHRGLHHRHPWHVLH